MVTNSFYGKSPSSFENILTHSASLSVLANAAMFAKYSPMSIILKSKHFCHYITNYHAYCAHLLCMDELVIIQEEFMNQIKPNKIGVVDSVNDYSSLCNR